jgi:hypothetical protein
MPLEQKHPKINEKENSMNFKEYVLQETSQLYVGIIVGPARDGGGSGSNSDSDAQFLGRQ